MGDSIRLAQLARQAGAYEREPLPSLEPPRRDTFALSPADQQDAREKLTLQRKGSVLYQDPSKQKRNLFRSKEKKAALNDTSGWSFTPAERFAALDRQIRQGDSINLAQAILTADANDPLDVNATYIFDDSGNARSSSAPNGWLELVAERKDLKYVRLLTAFGANQQSKDRALGKALEKAAFDVVQELLRNNANPNVEGTQYFMNAIAMQDTRLIEIFLAAITPMHAQTLNEALIASVCRGIPDLVALLFAHGASGDYADGRALSNAITGEHVEDAATILLYSSGTLSGPSLRNATEAACLVHTESKKRQLLEMLLCAGANPDTTTLQDQLLIAVQNGEQALVELLIRYGTSPDQNDAESLRTSIAMGQTSLAMALLQGPVSQKSASRALEDAKTLEDVEQFEFIVTALVEKGVSKDSLHKCLADTVDKGCGVSLAPMLISQGANLEYADAQCIRVALRQKNYSLLSSLLTGRCRPSILGNTLPDVMRIHPQSERSHVMASLLQKDISGKGLHVALQMLVSEDKDTIDYRLMDLLVRKKASVDFADDGGNCICIAAAQDNEKALDVLIAGDPSADTVSAALAYLPVSFAKSEAAGYEKSLRMMGLLLGKGAYGVPASRLLVEAVRDDYRTKAFDMLLTYNADANEGDGKAVEEAIRLPKIDALDQLCRRSKLERKTFAAQLPKVLEPKGFSLEKAALLANTASKYCYDGILDSPLLEEVQVNGSRKEVIELLLKLGASVDFREGAALRHVVSQGDVETTRLLLSAKPTKKNIARAFPATMHIKVLQTRYALMQALLQSGGPGMGDEALLQASLEASPEDLSHVELLLQHKASPNFKDGAPVLASVTAKNLPLIDLFVKSQLNANTLTNAFNQARHIDCSREQRHQIFVILFKSGYNGFDTSQALIEVVQRLPSDVETPILLLDHGASVDTKKAQAMQIAASAGSLQLLNILKNKKPRKESRDAAFQAAISAQLEDVLEKEVFLTLFETGITQKLINSALYGVTCRDFIDSSLLALFIRFGASLDPEEGGALYMVTARADPDLLRTLLTGRVSFKSTLDKSFNVCMGLEGEVRLQIAKQLLEKKPGVSIEVVSSFLALAVRENDNELLALMMNYSPDPSYNNGESLVLAAEAGDVALTTLLTKVEIPEWTLNRAFESMLDSRAIQSAPQGLEVAGILLPLGVEQSLIDRALLDGFDDPIDQKTKDLVELLIPFNPNFNGNDGKVFLVAARDDEVELFRRMATQKPDLNVVITSLIQEAEQWIEEEDEETAESDEGSSQAQEGATDQEEVAVDPEEVPIDSGENVADSGKAFDGHEKVPIVSENAIIDHEEIIEPELREVGNEDHIEKDKSGEDPHADEAQGDKTEHEKISGEEPEKEEEASTSTQTAEEKLVFYLQHLEECADRDDQPLDDSVIFTAMTGFPEGNLLVKHLLDNGCPANSHIDAELDPSGELLYLDSAGETETMTAVIWALTREEPEISEEVILEMLREDRDADISFETPITSHTAAHVASASGSCDVLKRLIEIGITLSKCNIHRWTALFYASRNNVKEAAEILHAAGSKTNDGSLHEAARESHFEVVEFLIASGHRVDFPSDLHADGLVGRTALEELCFNADPEEEDLEEWKADIHRCIEQLLPESVTDVHKSNGKTMLHLALENSVAVTQVLLDFPSNWENVNHPVHLYKDNQGYFYSPTKYVEFFCTDVSPETKEQLISLLLAKKCVDKYYAVTVRQPGGAVGLPEAIALAVEKQKRADFEHDEDLKRQADIAARDRAIKAEDDKRRAAVDKERHDTLMRQQRDREDSEKQIAQRKQAMARSHAQELQQQREAMMQEEHRLRQQALNEEASRRRAIQDSELAHKRQIAQEEYSAMQSKVNLEQQLIDARERARQKEVSSTLDLLSRREATARFEAQAASQRAGYN